MNKKRKGKCSQCIWYDICPDVGKANRCEYFDDGNYEYLDDREIDNGYLEADDFEYEEINIIELTEREKMLHIHGSKLGYPPKMGYNVELYESIKEEAEYIKQNGECVTREMTEEEKEKYGVNR